MKVLIQDADGANHYIKQGLAGGFAAAGFQVNFWNTSVRSTFDIFDEVEPDLFIGSTWQLDRALVKNITKRPNLKVMLSANHWGSADVEIDKAKYPIEFASNEEKKNVETILKVNKNVKGMCQYNGRYVKDTHNLWDNIGFSVTGIMLSSDVSQYFLEPLNPEYDCDIFYCGGKWTYKAQSIDKYLLPLCYPATRLKVRIVGSGGWSTPQYLGRADENTIRKYYRNAKIVPTLFEPHAVDFLPDVPQRVYQTAAAGGFQIAQRFVGWEDVFPNGEIVPVGHPEEFKEMVDHFLKNPDKTLVYREAASKKVYSAHTTIHRSHAIYNLFVTAKSENCEDIDNHNKFFELEAKLAESCNKFWSNQ